MKNTTHLHNSGEKPSIWVFVGLHIVAYFEWFGPLSVNFISHLGCRRLFLTEETQQWFITSTVQEIMCPMCHRSFLVNVFPTQKKTISVQHTLTCLDAFADQFNSLLGCQSPGGAVLWWEAVGAGGWCRISSNLKTDDIIKRDLSYCICVSHLCSYTDLCHRPHFNTIEKDCL